LALSFLCPTIEGLKSLSLAKLQDDPRARYPIRAFTVNKMAHDIERTPRVFTFIAERPRFRQIAQKGIKSSGGAREKRNCVWQGVFH